jgi:hypothetical protein
LSALQPGSFIQSTETTSASFPSTK